MQQMLNITILGGMLVCGAFAADPVVSTKNEPWKISGDLEEACSCRGPCPCWFMALPSRMTCDGVQVVFIKKGNYGKTPLDGLAVAQFVQSPEGKSMFESVGDWNFDNVYIDARATEAQRTALQALAAHLFTPGSKTRQFHYVSITRTINGAEHRITVGTVGGFSGHLIEGGYGGSPKISNPPLADPTHREYQQGETSELKYSDAGQGWNYENSNYMFNRFEVTGQEYEKFEAAMAEKLEKLKK